MVEIFLKTLPFFALIALGYGAGAARVFPAEATAWLTRFVFYFALSAMLFRFAATLSVAEVFALDFVLAYLCGTAFTYGTAMAVALLRGRPLAEAAVEAQCAAIGNTGFLGVPMLVLLLGPAAAGPVLMVLATDLIVFSTLITLIVTGAKGGRLRAAAIPALLAGLLRNPMILSIALGLLWSAARLPFPAPAEEFLALLGAAATPGALFAIGASLAGRSAERLTVAAWLAACKLLLHPAAVAVAALLLFPVERVAAGTMIAAAALPVAGNVYILAEHFGVAPRRVSTAILLSTAASILTLPAVIAWSGPG